MSSSSSGNGADGHHESPRGGKSIAELPHIESPVPAAPWLAGTTFKQLSPRNLNTSRIVSNGERPLTVAELAALMLQTNTSVTRHLQVNIDRLILPLLQQLERLGSPDQARLIALLRDRLAHITAPYISKLESACSGLRARELAICEMVRAGLSSKEIATYLNVSEETVRSARKAIRRKLGIAGKPIDLEAYLRSL